MKRFLLITIVIFTSAFFIGCRQLAQERDTKRFSHKRHLSQGLGCDSCHKLDKENVTIPDMDHCLECHDDASERCNMCHSHPDLASDFVIENRGLNFNHTLHVKENEIECTECHKKVKNSNDITDDLIPHMKVCLECHRSFFDSMQCDICHKDLKRSGLRPILDLSHRGRQAKNHKRWAKGLEKNCRLCHDQGFCIDCHTNRAPLKAYDLYPDRQDMDFIHTGDFLSRHFVEYSKNPSTCRRCHSNSFCQDCHKKAGVLADDSDAITPHGNDWRLRHGTEARKDPSRCAVCHERGEKTDCIRCHKTSGGLNNPHPDGWKYPKKSDKNIRPCIYCHK